MRHCRKCDKDLPEDSFNWVLGKRRNHCAQCEHLYNHDWYRKTFSSEFYIWKSIIARCCNLNNKRYSDYGGRGIKICEQWRVSFKAFFDYVGARPSVDHSMDRYPNNDGNYEPGNVRWATRYEQSWNSRRVTMLTHNGQTACLNEWSRRTGIRRQTISKRIILGWPIESVLGRHVVKK